VRDCVVNSNVRPVEIVEVLVYEVSLAEFGRMVERVDICKNIF
jgi:hypothetical protein